MTINTKTVKKLESIAARLTRDTELRKDLVQEMLLHFSIKRASEPGNSLQWNLRGCEFRAKNYLRSGKSIDSQKRANCGLHPTQFEYLPQENQNDIDHPDSFDLGQEVSTKDFVDRLMDSITEPDQHILTLLLNGYGVRAIARQLNIDHHTVVRHRKKIAFEAKQLLQEHT